MITAGAVDPVTAHVTIDRPREEVFDYLADIANHPEFSDHYLKDWRLTRVESVGRGRRRPLQDRRRARPLRLGRHDLHRGRARRTGSSPRAAAGKFNRNKTYSDVDARRRPSGGTSVEFTTETEPALPTDKLMEAHRAAAAGSSAAAARRCGGSQSILEEDYDRGARATVAGL